MITMRLVPVTPAAPPRRGRGWTIAISLLLHALALLALVLFTHTPKDEAPSAPSYELMFEGAGSPAESAASSDKPADDKPPPSAAPESQAAPAPEATTPPTPPAPPTPLPDTLPAPPAPPPLAPPVPDQPPAPPQPAAPTGPLQPETAPAPPSEAPPTPTPPIPTAPTLPAPPEPAPPPPQPLPATPTPPAPAMEAPEEPQAPSVPEVRLEQPAPPAPAPPLVPDIVLPAPPPPPPPSIAPARPRTAPPPPPSAGTFANPMDLNFHPAPQRFAAPRLNAPPGSIASRSLDLSTGAPKPGPNRSEAFFDARAAKLGADWMEGVHTYWLRHRYYPTQALQNGEDGNVDLELTVDRHGKVTAAVVRSRSGSAWLDMAAVGTFRGAQLPPIPEQVEAPYTVTITINYLLLR